MESPSIFINKSIASKDCNDPNIKSFHCSQNGCSFKTKYKRSLDRHVDTIHKVKCKIKGCQRIYASKLLLKAHMIKRHQDNIDVQSIKSKPKSHPKPRQSLSVASPSDDLLGRFIIINGLEDSKMKEMPDSAMSLSCNQRNCRFETYNQYLLDAHMKSEHQDVNMLYECRKLRCTFSTYSSSYFREHTLFHSSRINS